MSQGNRNGGPSSYARQILAALRKNYLPAHPRAKFNAYRKNDACVRVRVIDPDFMGRDLFDREEMVMPILESLPEQVQGDISVLLLIPPEEQERSLLSWEFDARLKSRVRRK